MLKSRLALSSLTITVLLSIAFVSIAFFLYGSAGHDDSHITFWASYTLKEFGEMVNYNGDRIEQSSSLLLTVLTALLAFVFHSDVVITGYVITLLAGAGALLMTARLAQKWDQGNISLVVLLLATSPAFLLWNTSGMESTLAALCLLAFIVQWGDLLSSKAVPNAESVILAALATLALIAVRPEMITIVAIFVFVMFIYRRTMKIRGNIGIIVFYSTILLSISLLAVFRYCYFGSPMPLPVSAKVSSPSFSKLHFGFYYLLRYGFANIIFIIGILVALTYSIRQLIKRHEPDFHFILSATSLLAYAAFIVFSGGDWMQMGRFLVPVLPIAAVLTMLHLRNSIKNSSLLYLVVALLVILNINGNWQAVKSESHGIPVWAGYHIAPQHQQRYSVFEQYNQEHLRDMDVIDTLDHTIDALLQKGHQPVTVMSGQSGMVFFYTAKKYFSHDGSSKVRFYDLHALVESSLLKCPLINDIERSSQGLYFDFDLFFARQPGLLYECNIPKPDIIYDINDLSRQLPNRMATQGYTLIHREGGKMAEPDDRLPFNTLPAANFIMVSNDLLDNLGHPPMITIKYAQFPLESRW